MLAACHSERCQRCAEASHNESGSAYPAGGNRPRTAGKEYTESESLSVVFAYFGFTKEIRKGLEDHPFSMSLELASKCPLSANSGIISIISFLSLSLTISLPVWQVEVMPISAYRDVRMDTFLTAANKT
jgi:hypothetical protein